MYQSDKTLITYALHTGESAVTITQLEG
jgi:hypothetical protein